MIEVRGVVRMRTQFLTASVQSTERGVIIPGLDLYCIYIVVVVVDKGSTEALRFCMAQSGRINT